MNSLYIFVHRPRMMLSFHRYVIQETKQYFGQIGKSMDEVRDTLGELSQAVDDSRSTAKVMQGYFQCHVEAENR